MQVSRVCLVNFPSGVGFLLRQAGNGNRLLNLKSVSSPGLADLIRMKTVYAFSGVGSRTSWTCAYRRTSHPARRRWCGPRTTWPRSVTKPSSNAGRGAGDE